MRRVPLAILLVLGMLAIPATVAAAAPQLTATAVAGREIDVAGSGFPATAEVTLDIQRNGAAAGSQSLRTDANGAFSATIPAGPGRGGRYDLVATSGSVRVAASVVAVETAGGTGGTRPSAPATDASLPAAPVGPPSQPATTLVAVLSLLAVGMALFGVARRTRQVAGRARAENG